MVVKVVGNINNENIIQLENGMKKRLGNIDLSC